ncbi:hypothetical protein DENSPDRAFT_145889 [Dentipellis sp. KUC8613]|nr:hypothetical protein DENSPDRAFT_145889 [Dentipellis sp. KUC8613]
MPSHEMQAISLRADGPRTAYPPQGCAFDAEDFAGQSGWQLALLEHTIPHDQLPINHHPTTTIQRTDTHLGSCFKFDASTSGSCHSGDCAAIAKILRKMAPTGPGAPSRLIHMPILVGNLCRDRRFLNHRNAQQSKCRHQAHETDNSRTRTPSNSNEQRRGKKKIRFHER